MARGMFPARGTAGSAGGMATTTSSPALTRWPGSRIVRPPIATWPARTSALRRERESASMPEASTRSSRSPAWGSATTRVSISARVSVMGSSQDDDKPLDPAQARLIARVRRLMVISGAATLLGIAVVLGLLGYRVFRGEGSVTARDVTARLPKGARVVATAVAGDRITVTIETGGTTEILTFDLDTLKPAGRLRFATEP